VLGVSYPGGIDDFRSIVLIESEQALMEQFAGSSPTAYKQAPMTIGQILDRSFKLLPGLVRPFLPVLVISCILTSTQLFGASEMQHGEQLKPGAGPVLNVGAALLNLPFAIYRFFAPLMLASEHWRGNLIPAKGLARRITFGLLMRTLGLSIVVAWGTIFGFILLIIPGIIFALNRILAFYVLVNESTTTGDAMKRSKKLMSAEPWYTSSGPKMRVSAIMILGFILAIFPQIGLQVLVLGIAGLSPVLNAGLFFCGTVLAAIVKIFNMLCYTGFYFDLRARYEALDLMGELDQLKSGATGGR
jgi:hypothetical protein